MVKHHRYGYEVDPETGLPKLPGHLFWRIRSDYNNPRIVIVRRTEKPVRFLFWKWTQTTEKETDFYTWVFHGLHKSNIDYAANEVLKKYEESLTDDWSLLGDYPPKKLA